MEYIVRNFAYNGFSGKLLDGNAPYKAQFIKWTNDPGIAKMVCSDGKERLIPSFAVIPNSKDNKWPKQTYEGGKTIIGAPSSSV